MFPLPYDLPVLHAIEGLRTPALDAFFLHYTDLGRGFWLLLFGGLLFWLASPRLAYRLFFAVLAADWLGDLLKHACCVPRPWMLDPTLHPLAQAMAGISSWSFPSGHVTNFSAFVFALAANRRSKALWAAAVPLALLMALSRLWLGVHTPTDVLTGLAIGLLAAIASARLTPVLEASPHARATATAIAVALVAAAWFVFHAIPAPETDPRYGQSLYRSGFAVLALLAACAAERRWVCHAPAALPPASRLPVGAIGWFGLLLTCTRIGPWLKPGLGSEATGYIVAAANPLWIVLIFPALLVPLRHLRATPRKES
jgi:membrane-associated phospholipid phosphatase